MSVYMLIIKSINAARHGPIIPGLNFTRTAQRHLRKFQISLVTEICTGICQCSMLIVNNISIFKKRTGYFLC